MERPPLPTHRERGSRVSRREAIDAEKGARDHAGAEASHAGAEASHAGAEAQRQNARPQCKHRKGWSHDETGRLLDIVAGERGRFERARRDEHRSENEFEQQLRDLRSVSPFSSAAQALTRPDFGRHGSGPDQVGRGRPATWQRPDRLCGDAAPQLQQAGWQSWLSALGGLECFGDRGAEGCGCQW